MRKQLGMRLGVPAFLILVAWMAAESVAGQGRSSPVDRALTTAEGQPDLQGVWTNNGVTPLQRPEALKDREFLTDAELEQLKRRSSELFERQQAGDLIGDRLFQEFVKDPNLRPFDPDTGNYNSFWLVGRSFDNRTSLIIDPPNGRLPPRVASSDQGRRPRPTGATSGPANPEDLSLGERCITYGVPWLVAGYNSYFEIFQTPNHVAILQEMIHDVRSIATGACVCGTATPGAGSRATRSSSRQRTTRRRRGCRAAPRTCGWLNGSGVCPRTPSSTD
jgi:hypothetical protein